MFIYFIQKALFILEIFRFLYFYLLLLSPLSAIALRGQPKINLKVYNAINCPNKNLITHFILYLEKEKRYDLETLSIDRVLNKNHFYGKFMQKMCTESQSHTSSEFCLITQNSHCMQGIHLKIRYFERGLSISPKKLTLFFLLNPVPFNIQSYKKRKRPGANDQSLFNLQNKFRKIPLFVIYFLTKFNDMI